MIYDISQRIFDCEVYPGDPVPEKITKCSMEDGDLYNLTGFTMCAHNGTHVDAPLHFYKDGAAVDGIALEKFMGPAYVKSFEGDLSADDALNILSEAKEMRRDAEKRILIKGNAVVTLEAAKVFAEAGVFLVGNESQSVGPVNAPMAVHLVLLGAEVVLLEGIRLASVPDGAYFLNCAPLNLNGSEGAPCRAVLTDIE